MVAVVDLFCGADGLSHGFRLEGFKVVQKYLFNHLWLLDPAWERAEGTEIMERSVKGMFQEIDSSLSNNEMGRLDIGYRKTAGQHVIVELKRPERIVTIDELIAQVKKYRNGMQGILDKQGVDEPVEIVVLLGHQPKGWNSTASRNDDIDMLRVLGTRVVFYDKLLADAEKAYKDYLTKQRVVDKLTEIIQAIDDYAPSPSP